MIRNWNWEGRHVPDDDGDDGQAAQPVDQDEAPPAASAVTQLTVPVHTQHV